MNMLENSNISFGIVRADLLNKPKCGNICVCVAHCPISIKSGKNIPVNYHSAMDHVWCIYLALENVFMFNFCSKMLLMVSNEKL